MVLWLVQAGARGELENLALEKKIVVIGWGELGDLITRNCPKTFRPGCHSNESGYWSLPLKMSHEPR